MEVLVTPAAKPHKTDKGTQMAIASDVKDQAKIMNMNDPSHWPDKNIYRSTARDKAP